MTKGEVLDPPSAQRKTSTAGGSLTHFTSSDKLETKKGRSQTLPYFRAESQSEKSQNVIFAKRNIYPAC
jgi:hypothetical protein